MHISLKSVFEKCSALRTNCFSNLECKSKLKLKKQKNKNKKKESGGGFFKTHTDFLFEKKMKINTKTYNVYIVGNIKTKI